MSGEKLLWGGRFSRRPAETARDFSSSLDVDRRMAGCDVRGSIAHARMLAHSGIITDGEARLIVTGLLEVGDELAEGSFVFEPSDEDIHTAVERRLYEKIGNPAGKLHTGRSRNDQVALDEKLYLRDFIDRLQSSLAGLQSSLLCLAAKNRSVIMPFYTHLQPAQPSLFGHWALAYVEMFQRDRERVGDARKRVNISPLGAGAGAGSSLPLDPAFTARELGFDGFFRNSIDAVSDRDALIEVMMAMALIAVHLSRLCEELVLWSSREFNFIEIDQRYCTGSSALPQKKNPDMAELARGKTGAVFGGLFALLTVLKGLPLAYNRDLQEDKAPFFTAADNLLGSLEVITEMIPGTRVNRRAMAEAVEEGFSSAFDLAEFLVRGGVPFREAHRVIGALVRYCRRRNKKPRALSLAELKRFSPLFTREARSLMSARASLEHRRTPGSPSPEMVERELAAWFRRLEAGKSVPPGDAGDRSPGNKTRRSRARR